MAEVFPNEGLAVILGQWPGNDADLATMYLCLYKSPTGVITPTQTRSAITESDYTGYARMAMAAASWLTPVAVSGGMQMSYPQVQFPTCGLSGNTIYGFFIADASAINTGHCIGMANFDDNTPVTLVNLDILKVTASVLFGN